MRVCLFRHFGKHSEYIENHLKGQGIHIPCGSALSASAIRKPLFNAFTRGSQPTGISAGRIEVHTAVDVPDPRVDVLSGMFSPKKTTYAKVTYADIAGLDGSAGKNGISGALLNQLTQMDGFIHVARCFENDNVPHPQGSIDPARDIAMMDSEFVLNDLIAVERKLERLADERRKGGGRDRAQIERDIELFERMRAQLEVESPLRDMDCLEEENRSPASASLAASRCCCCSTLAGQPSPRISYPHKHSQAAALQAGWKWTLPSCRLKTPAVHAGVRHLELGLNRIIRLSYDLLG